jgi:hypothetical protein
MVLLKIKAIISVFNNDNHLVLNKINEFY